MAIGYRQPAHFNLTRPKGQLTEWRNTEDAAKELREELKSKGYRVRITPVVNWKDHNGVKHYHYKVYAELK